MARWLRWPPERKAPRPAFPLVRAALRRGTPDRIRTGATALRVRTLGWWTTLTVDESAGRSHFRPLNVDGRSWLSSVVVRPIRVLGRRPGWSHRSSFGAGVWPLLKWTAQGRLGLESTTFSSVERSATHSPALGSTHDVTATAAWRSLTRSRRCIGWWFAPGCGQAADSAGDDRPDAAAATCLMARRERLERVPASTRP